MSRDLREEIAGGTFHVMNRGNRKVVIFQDNHDRWVFWRIVYEELTIHGVVLCALCLMGNHFHMVITTPHGNLADFVGAVESRYATYVNGRYGYVGHLFQGRYIPVVIDDDFHLLTALCYLFLNPVSAHLVTKIEDYPWSTYGATIGLQRRPRLLSLEWLQTLFAGTPFAEAQRRFHELMQQGKPVVAYFDQQQLDVDPDAVKRVIQSYVGGKIRMGALPRRYRSILRNSLPELLPSHLTRPELQRAVYEARVEHGYRVVEIAQHLRMHRVTISRLFRDYSRSQKH
jgi:putative transposase